MIETRARTAVRSVTYRLTAWLLTIPVTLLFVEDVASATEYSTIIHVVLTLDYYLHERIWLKVKWGVKHDNRL